MTEPHPALRADLDCRHQRTEAGDVLVIKDPVRGNYFRLQPAECFIAGQLDGRTDLEEVRKRAEENFGVSLPEDTLERFVRMLDRNGLLESEQAPGKKTAPRAAGSLLYYRVRLVDPERFLAWLQTRTRWLFTRGFVYLSGVSIAIAMLVTLFNGANIASDAAKLYTLSAIPLLLITIFVVVSLHEIAHGLTCKHFGGEVHEMGFMLMYFQPAFYCNVSDAWLFPEKYKRLWVGFAGPYFELFTWALATIAWRVTDTGTLVNQAALITIAVSGLRTLLNFNPLIKLDGYYLLSDLLEIPNLRKKSFRYVGDRLKSLLGTGHAPDATPREKRIYLTYGATAWLFSVSLITYIGMMFGEYLIIEQQRVAFFALTGILGMRFRDKFNNLFGSRKRHSRKSGSHSGNGESKGSPRESRSGRWLVRGAVLAAVGLLLFFGQLELRVSGPVVVLPEHNADVRAEIDGTVSEILVDEGDIVRKGDLVAKLSDREHRAELAKTQAEIMRINAQLDKLLAGPTGREIEVARSEVSSAEDVLSFARAKHRRNRALFEQQLISQNDFDTTREQQAAAENQWIQARNKLQVLLAGTRPEEIDAAEAELASLHAQRDYLEGQLERVNVQSPASGVITTPSRELRALVRQAISKGDLIAKVHDLDVVTVEAAISEKEIADVRVGQKVGVKVRAYPERVFQGQVIAIAPATQGATRAAASEDSKDKGLLAVGGSESTSVRVTTVIDNRDGLLKPGMTGMAKVYCGERRIIDLVIRRLSRTFRVEFWSWW